MKDTEKPMFFKVCFCGILLVAVFWSSSTFAGVLSNDAQQDLPYHIKADSLGYDDNTRTYTARGRVTITKGNQSLQADAIDFNAGTMEAKAWDNVHFRWGKDWLSGTRLEINLDAGIGTLYDGTVFIRESHFYIRGDRIEKTGKDSYYIADGRFTTCDGDSPAWKVTGKDLRVTLEGYGTVKHAAFWAKSVPVLYAPFLVFPAKTKRQTGLLVPQVAYSDRDGLQYHQPFFWAISESADATFYEHYMADRGVKHGLEYRYVLTPGSKGAIIYDFLYDRKIDDSTGSQEPAGSRYKGFRGDSEDRLNKKRWWLRMKSDQDLPAGFKAKLDMDLVSDQDYLREFSRGYSGFKSNDSYFHKEFGRDLDDYTDTVRLNRLNLSRAWDQYSLNADFRWYDDVIIRKNDEPDATLQRLPSISFEGSKQKLSALPLYFDLESSYDYFWRDYGTRGHRADLHPRLYYPLRVCNYFDFEPSVGLRETIWHVERYEDETPRKEDWLHSRKGFDFKVDLSTELSRIFHLKGEIFDMIRHAVRPRVVYNYVSLPEQEDYPWFEGIDRIEEKNVLTYSVTNNFTAKSIERQDGRAGQQDHATPRYRYHDFCRIKFTQSYDILEARRDERGKKKGLFLILKGRSNWNYPDISICKQMPRGHPMIANARATMQSWRLAITGETVSGSITGIHRRAAGVY
jgi:LPS-assembly protein